MEYLIYVLPLCMAGMGLLIVSELRWRAKLPIQVALNDEQLESYRTSLLMRGIHVCGQCYEQYIPDERELEYCSICAPNLFPLPPEGPVEKPDTGGKQYFGNSFVPAYITFPDLFHGEEHYDDKGN